MSIQINHPVNPAPADAPTWSTDEMTEQFEVTAFAAPFVSVTRKSDGVKGTLEFDGRPRVYHTFRPD